MVSNGVEGRGIDGAVLVWGPAGLDELDILGARANGVETDG